MASLPAIFVSHGAPDLLLHETPSRAFLKQLGQHLEPPRAILIISAHWLTQVPTVSTAAQVTTIHDFWGFPAELYAMHYIAPGAPELATQVKTLLATAGFETATHPSRGLDHGAWEPLVLMYPEAGIPVMQLSLQPAQGTHYHYRLGQAIAPLRQAGVLILASGSATHNLRAFGAYSLNAKPPDWAKQFDDWLATAIAQNDVDALLDYRSQAPYAVQNHPSDEHLLPLFVALGAGGEAPRGTELHRSFTYGAFSMAAYAFS
ncbi:MAG TPA: dioxygenase [Leptolyngbyaceae cyanobacterium M33_DOE_097]|uniref:Dioxygenase n=1 Tax=Oscillatoriales cyanobacterium SpSt-418 TaxID=2282169 RepID=A0A7C3PI55_9CYAN|nr:dioxygenase [Leptolyngbyaceae cyanobacterium M33_DOE_097]